MHISSASLRERELYDGRQHPESRSSFARNQNIKEDNFTELEALQNKTKRNIN